MTKRIFSKSLALLLAVIMVIGLVPAVAVASEPDSITAYITISVAGNIPKGTGDTLIAQVPVKVTDHNDNNVYDIDDALFALHEAYYTDGAASGYSSANSAWGLGITKLWGDTSNAYAYWVNNASANSLTDTVSAGDHITAFVYKDATSWSDSYVRFAAFTKTAAVGESISLKLENAGFDASWNTVWSSLSEASIYDSAKETIVLATTNPSGEATVSFPSVGVYYITASHPSKNIVPPVCKITVLESAPLANDTTLASLNLTFPGVAASSALSYVGTSGLSVGNAVESVRLDATVHNSEATIAATFQDAHNTAFTPYNLGDSAPLAIGANTFKLTVTNGMDTQIHTLIVTRKAEETRNIPNEVAAVMNGVKTVTGDAPYTDWILAMSAAGLSPTDAQLQTYLASVLTTVDSFINSGRGYPATMAKIALALTSLGIDARQIPDPDGGDAIDLVKVAATAYTVKADALPLYSAPYLLSLYDLPNYEVPVGASSTRLELIDAILAAKEAWAEWGYDGVGMVLPALAPYYNATTAVNGIDLAKCQEVTEAVNDALSKMSDAQTMDGGFGAPNSNTISTVITGLNAIKINSNSDSRFIKGGTSLLMNLLSFRTSDQKLGFADATSANPFACIQGFQALSTWENLSNTRSSNLYHFSKEIAPYINWPSAQLLTGIAVTSQPTTITYNLGTADTTPDTTGIVVTAIYNADASNTKAINIADCSVSKIDCTTAGTKTVTVTYQGKTATFFVTVLDASGNAPKQDIVSVSVRNNSTVIARNSSVVIEAGVTTALDVLITVLDASNKPYVIRNGGYVAEIAGLGEFDKGANSGWLYSINGVTPQSTAASDYVLSNGDTVLWYYTLDYTTDSSSSNWTSSATSDSILTPSATVSKGVAAASVVASDMTSAIADAKKNNSNVITIEPMITGEAKKVTIGIPKSSLSDIAAHKTIDITVKTPIGSVTIPNETLTSITSQASGATVAVNLGVVDHSSLTLAQKEVVGGKSVFDISILSGSNKITNFDNKHIKISLPYTLKSGEQASFVTAWYLDSSGKLHQMAATYDKATGLATFETPHLSYYVVGCAEAWANTFSDVKSTDWFYGAVKYAVQKGLFNGTAEATFAPNRDLTRAMLVTALYRMENKPAVTGAGSFQDVQSGQWYTDAVTWASTNQIVVGYGGGLFGTNDSITREQMAMILYRYAQYKSYEVTKTVDLTDYKDKPHISKWAVDAMKWANANGLITGTTSETLAPTDSASRAQVATILMRFAETFLTDAK